ncbi:MAG: hypothetical protein Q8N39_10900 [Pelolinea sp.]|nr:hypothetical protein [Pelolinea sp.]
MADISRKAIDQVKDTIKKIACCQFPPSRARRPSVGFIPVPYEKRPRSPREAEKK